MIPVTPEKLLSQIAAFVDKRVGLHFPKEKWRDLERGLKSACDELGYGNITECAERLLGGALSKKEVETVAAHLTVGETYFLREPKSFEMLEQKILPELAGARRQDGSRRLRIWSAGCSSGEEPYSIAIALSRAIPDLQNWAVTILATDINRSSLEKAAAGIYGDWSFRDTAPWFKERYFRTVEPGRYELQPQLRQMVTFAYLNLAEDVFPSLLNNTNAMDIIFCRNVLMYFSHRQARKVVRAFHFSLLDGGWLVASTTETLPTLYSPFVPVTFSGVTFHRKEPAIKTVLPAVEPALRSALHHHHTKNPPSVEKMRDRVVGSGRPKRLRSKQRLFDEALVLHQCGRYAEAIKRLKSLVELEPRNANAASLLARAYANQGKLEDAAEWCDSAITHDKLDPELYYLRAMILQEQVDFAGSAIALKRALYLDHDFVLAHFAMGNLALHDRRPDDARRSFRNALALLARRPPEQVLPGSEGITAGRLTEIIRAALQPEEAAA